MDIRKSLVLLSAGFLALASARAGAQAAGGGFAVLELFTSEGCSSCPPADEALAEVSRAAMKEGLPVYALEWHVDYWDSLGWKDPFDSHAATERQYAYARALPSDVYTPQLIVNGSLVPRYAGDTSEIERDVQALVHAPSSRRLQVRVLSVDPGVSASRGSPGPSLRVQADVTGPSDGANLLLVLAETGLGASPTAGENAGRRLVHSSVVRGFMVVPAVSGETRFAVPPGVDLARSTLVGILQDPRSLRISDADRAVIPVHAAATVLPGIPAATVLRGISPARLTGMVVDPAGRAVKGAVVQACSATLCFPAVTDSNGSFVFERLAPGDWDIALDQRTPAVKIALAAGQDISLRTPLVLVH